MFNKEQYISHLSKDELLQMRDDYYAGEKINSLIEKYSLNISNKIFLKILPDFETNTKCEFCNNKMFGEPLNRSYDSHNNRFCIVYCPECGHTISLDKFYGVICDCKYCVEKRENIKNLKKQSIINTFSKKEVTPKIDIDSFFDLLILKELPITQTSNRNEIFFKHIYNTTWSDELAIKIIKKLLNKNLIRISEESSIDAFDFVIDKNGHYTAKIKEPLDIIYVENFTLETSAFKYLATKADPQKILDIWTNLISIEILLKLNQQMKRRGLYFNFSQDGWYLLNEVALERPLKDLLYIVNASVKIFQKSNLGKNKIADSAISSIKKNSDWGAENNYPYDKGVDHTSKDATHAFSFFCETVLNLPVVQASRLIPSISFFKKDNLKKLNENKLFFITAFERLPDNFFNIDSSRCFGFYPEYETAAEALHTNRCDMHELLYEYAVIEKIGPGIHPECFKSDRQFFKWDNSKEGFFEIDEPKELKNLCNFSLG